MVASSPSPISVRILDATKLLLVFEDGDERVFDVTPYLTDSYFTPLKNPVIFKTVKVNGLTVEWIGGIDICPDELYEKSEPLER